MLTLDEAKDVIASYDSSYDNSVRDLINTKHELVTACALLDTLIASGVGGSAILAQNSRVSVLKAQISSIQTALKQLSTDYNTAQDVVNSTMSLPDPNTLTVNPFVGVTGPTGPAGEQGECVVGPTGAKGKELSNSSAVVVGSLSVSTALYASSAVLSSAAVGVLTALTVNVGQLLTTSLTVSGNVEASVISSDSLTANTTSALSISADFVNITGVCTAQGLVSAGSVVVSDQCTALGGYVGTLLTPSQPNITEVGTLSSVSVTNGVTAGSMYVSGICTAGSGFDGTIVAGNQPQITNVGTLSSLSVSGPVSAGSIIATGMCTASAYVGTILTPSQPNITSLGTLTSLNVSGAASVGSLYIPGVCTVLGTIQGTLATGAQPNIIAVGTQSSLTVSGNTSLGAVAVSGLCTATGYIGTLLTPSQPYITSVGTLTSLTVTGSSSLGNVNLSGICTAPTYVGTLLTPVQPNITSVGTLSGLSVLGVSTFGGTISQSYGGNSCFVSTTSNTNKNCITLATDSGATQYEIGVRGSGGVPSNSFYVTNLKSANTVVNTDRLVINSLGYCGINTSSPNTPLDVGGSNSTMIGALANPVGYFGAVGSGGGVVIGSGNSGTNPFIAASKTSAGTSLGLDIYTADTVRMSISTSGDISIPGTLSVAGVDFAAAIGGLGYGQSWTNLTSSRALSTTYCNTSSRPVLVNACVSASGGVGTNTFQFMVGVTTSMSACQATSTRLSSTITEDYANLSVVVPPLNYYQLSKSGITSSTVWLSLWSELS